MKIVKSYDTFSVGDRIVCVNNFDYEELVEGQPYVVSGMDQTNVVIDINGNSKTAWEGRFVLESEYQEEKHERLRDDRRKKLEKLENNTEK